MNNSNNIYIVDLILSAKSTVKYLFSKWVLIFLVAFLGGIAGIIYAWVQKPTYTAELIFSSEARSDNILGGYAGLASQFGFDLGGGGGGAFEGDNLIELLRTRNIVEQTLLSEARGFSKNKLLIDAYIENNKPNNKKKPDTLFSKIQFVKNPASPERVRDSILKNISLNIIKKQLTIEKIDKKLNYIVVKMKDNNELFAKDFVETLMKNASEYYIEYKSRKARKNFDLIYRLTDSIKGLLYGNIESYASSNDLNVNPLRQIAKTGSQKIQVNAQANTALYTELLKQLGLAQITLQRETPLIQIIDHPSLPLKKEKKGRLLTGVMFSFIFCSITIFYLLVKRWLKNAQQQQTDDSVPA